MSYCRWSSDDFMCDLYVYESIGGGWATHVADNKRVFNSEMPPQLADCDDSQEWEDQFIERYVKVNKIVDLSTIIPIGLPHDGEIFNDPTAAACADRLEALRAIGYRVPQYAINSLREE